MDYFLCIGSWEKHEWEMILLGLGKEFQVFFSEGTYIIQFWTQLAFEG